MKKLAIATACVLFCAPALAQSPTEKIGVNAALGVSPTTKDFLTEAAQGGLFEIRSSELALKQGNAGTRNFARRMIDDHTKIDTSLKNLVQTKKINVTIPGEPSHAQQSMIDKLDKLKGPDFDKEYRDDQYSAHKEAVSLFQRYAKGGDNSDLKQWAAETEPTLEEHLQMARDLDKQAAR